MYKVNDELNNNLKAWSEGNEYLYSLLYLSWQHGIRTSACCGGHIDNKNSTPYIVFIVDENNLPYFNSMIGAMENTSDVCINLDYRDSQYVPNDSKIVVTVYCMMSNRMKVFYNLAASILKKHEIKTLKGEKFYQLIVDLLHTEKSEIEKYIADGMVVGSTFTTFTKEREEYLIDKKKLLYRLRQILTKKCSKYDISQDTLEEEPQIRFKV